MPALSLLSPADLLLLLPLPRLPLACLPARSGQLLSLATTLERELGPPRQPVAATMAAAGSAAMGGDAAHSGQASGDEEGKAGMEGDAEGADEETEMAAEEMLHLLGATGGGGCSSMRGAVDGSDEEQEEEQEGEEEGSERSSGGGGVSGSEEESESEEDAGGWVLPRGRGAVDCTGGHDGKDDSSTAAMGVIPCCSCCGLYACSHP